MNANLSLFNNEEQILLVGRSGDLFVINSGLFLITSRLLSLRTLFSVSSLTFFSNAVKLRISSYKIIKHRFVIGWTGIKSTFN